MKMEHSIKRTQAVDGKYREHGNYVNDLNGKFKYYRAIPEKALLTEQSQQQWFIDKKWAVLALVETMPRELATSVFKQYVKKWEKFVLANGNARSANIWFRKITDKTRESARRFPVPIDDLYFDSGRKALAQIWCDKCVSAVTECAEQKMSIVDTKLIVQEIGDQWSFSVKDSKQEIERLDDESDEDFEIREADEQAWLSMLRLLDEKWWERKIDTAFRQFYEHCQIINGRVHKGASRYLSVHGVKDFRARKVNAQLAMSQLIALNNETGQEMEMLDVIKGSIANPDIRRQELMCRLRGFEDIADENKLVGGFFTLTAPSKYHAFTARKDGKGAYLNTNYKGASPKQTQEYLCSVWAKARAKLKRLNIEIIGFRVCEPHHDATPHWHALFFFKPEHEQLIRYVLADYFTQDEREELNVCDDEFLIWGKAIGGDDSLVTDMFDIEKIKESGNLIESISERINARFDYKAVDNEKGSATGYLAKYISKNIDGFNLDNQADTPANKLAELACGWASTWRIRQFQQIGGPPVSVWRELRRLEQDKEVAEAKAKAKEAGEKYVPKIRSLIDIKGEHDPIEVARIAADLGNWSMYIEAMGGIFCTRAHFPVAMVYKQVDNAYGETVKKLKALGCFTKTMITRSEDWSIVKKNADREGFDPKRNDSSALGVLSITVRGNEMDSVEQPVIDQAGQLGVIIDEFEARILTAGGALVLSDRIVGDERRIERMKLHRTSLDGGFDELKIINEIKKRKIG
jgi:hypothetical protein